MYSAQKKRPVKKKNIIAVIPAKLNSKRFPRKALTEIFNLPMLGHVYKRAALCKDFDEIIIATPDDEIKTFAQGILNAKVIKTPASHNNPIESSAFAVQKYQQENKLKFDITVIISGDEPMITNDMIANAISPFYIENDLKVSCLMCEIPDQKTFLDHNAIKVVVDINNNALYFSREPIPSHYSGKLGIPPLKKVNVMPFDTDFLIYITQQPPTTLEIIENIYLLRVLEYGFKVKMILIDEIIYSVDTPEDLEIVKQKMKNDHLLSRYLSSLN